jgi:hypothetical protein
VANVCRPTAKMSTSTSSKEGLRVGIIRRWAN